MMLQSVLFLLSVIPIVFGLEPLEYEYVVTSQEIKFLAKIISEEAWVMREGGKFKAGILFKIRPYPTEDKYVPSLPPYMMQPYPYEDSEKGTFVTECWSLQEKFGPIQPGMILCEEGIFCGNDDLRNCPLVKNEEKPEVGVYSLDIVIGSMVFTSFEDYLLKEKNIVAILASPNARYVHNKIHIGKLYKIRAYTSEEEMYVRRYPPYAFRLPETGVHFIFLSDCELKNGQYYCDRRAPILCDSDSMDLCPLEKKNIVEVKKSSLFYR